MAASGRPRSCLTLTVNTATGGTPTERYRLLHHAWKSLVKRILRQFKKPPEDRWLLITEEGYQYQELQSYQITRPIKANRIQKIHYMAFAEETEAKEPHLHILLRTHYIPQRWISQQMDELLQSPIVWVERIKSAGSAIAYVTKYVTKAPAQFGKSRRYWCSKFYQVKNKFKAAEIVMNRRNSQMVKQSFRDFVTEIVRSKSLATQVTRTIVKITPISSVLKRCQYPEDWLYEPEVVASYLWLAKARRETGV